MDDNKRRISVQDINWNADIDDSDLLSFVDTHYKAGKRRRNAWEKQAATQLAWVAGDQQEWYDQTTDKLVDYVQELLEDVPLHQRSPVTVNGLQGQVLARMAMVISKSITWHVRPSSSDDDWLTAARIGKKLLQYQFSEGDRHTRRRTVEGLWQMFCTGCVFPKIVWDPDGGDPEVHEPRATDEERGTPSLYEVVVAGFKKRVREKLGAKAHTAEFTEEGGLILRPGKVKVHWRTGFDLTEPSLCTDITKAAWIIDTERVTIESLREEFGAEAISDISPEVTSDEYTATYKGQYGITPVEDGTNVDPATHVLRHELYRPLSKSAREGYYAVVAGGIQLTKGKLPYDHGLLPFSQLKELPEESFRPRCTITHLMNIQKSRNRIASAKAAHVMAAMDPRIFAENQAKLPDGAFSSGPKVIKVEDGAISGNMIKIAEYPTLPMEAYRVAMELDQAMKDAGGIHDATAGKSEYSGESGRHAAMKNAADRRVNTVTRILIEDGFNLAGKLSLLCWHQFVKADRMIALTGPHGEPDVLRFKGEQLSPGRKATPDNFLVETTLGAEPNLQEEMAKLEALVQMQMVNPQDPNDRAMVRSMLGDETARRDDEHSRQEQITAGENRQIREGDTVMPAMGDRDEIHLAGHYRETTTEQFKLALVEDKALEQRMRVHIRAHEIQATEKMVRPQVLQAYTMEVMQAQYKVRAKEDLAKLIAARGGQPAAPVAPFAPADGNVNGNGGLPASPAVAVPPGGGARI